jgi:hypothetical protein
LKDNCKGHGVVFKSLFLLHPTYSIFKDFTGFKNAALTPGKLPAKMADIPNKPAAARIGY